MGRGEVGGGMMDELISKFEAYISGAIGRDEFSVWFYGVSRKAEVNYSGVALDLIHEVEGIFAEASSGSWSHEGLVEELESAVSRYRRVPQEVGATKHRSV
jgi:hypothetical protein